MVGVTLSDMQLFTAETGPAFAGGLSIIAAILSRLLPDLTVVKMLETQNEIEREQFPSLTQSRQVAVPLETVRINKDSLTRDSSQNDMTSGGIQGL
jgi:hypothetical protein